MFLHRFFLGPEDQRLQDDIWLASRGGVWPVPWGFFAIVLTSGLFWLTGRTAIGLPQTIAPILGSPDVVRVVVNILTVVVVSWVVFGICFFLFDLRVLTPYWKPRYGRSRTKRLNPMVGVLLMIVVIELFIGIFYMYDWLVGRSL